MSIDTIRSIEVLCMICEIYIFKNKRDVSYFYPAIIRLAIGQPTTQDVFINSRSSTELEQGKSIYIKQQKTTDSVDQDRRSESIGGRRRCAELRLA